MVKLKKRNLGNLGLKLGTVLIPLAIGWQSLPGFSTTNPVWQFNAETNQLEVTVKPGVKPQYSFVSRPARIVLDVPNTQMASLRSQTLYPGSVRKVSVTPIQSGVTRIVLELSPQAVLAKEQVEFKQVQESDRTSDRWTLRPLFTQDSSAPIAAQPSPDPSGANPAPVAAQPNPDPSGANPAPIAEQHAQDNPAETPDKTAQPTATPNPPAKPTSEAAPVPPTPDRFPPGLEPEATPASPTPAPEVPPTPPPAGQAADPATAPPSQAQDSPPPPNSTSPEAAAPDRSTVPSPAPPDAQATAAIEFGQPLPDAPEVEGSQSRQTDPNPSPPSADASSAANNGSNTRNSTVSLNSPPDPSAANSSAANNGVIERGRINLDRFTPQVILPAGTVILLRYPGEQPLKLQLNQPQSQTLVVQTALQDQSGNLIVPAGAEVSGQFETTRSGSRFVAQSMRLQGRSLNVAGRSNSLSGTRRQPSNRDLLKNSGVGALAGALLGGISGQTVVGGAAVGAGVTYATSPKPATIQAGQAIEIRLTQDLQQQ